MARTASRSLSRSLQNDGELHSAHRKSHECSFLQGLESIALVRNSRMHQHSRLIDSTDEEDVGGELDLPVPACKQSFALLLAFIFIGGLAFIFGAGQSGIMNTLLQNCLERSHVTHTIAIVGLFALAGGLVMGVVALFLAASSTMRENASHAVSLIVEQSDALVPELWRRRLSLLFTFLVLEWDQGLDGSVISDLFHDGRFMEAIVLFAIILVPQLLIWAFLRNYQMAHSIALVRVLFFPSLALLAVGLTFKFPAALPRWVLDLCIVLSSLSMEPLVELCSCWKSGRKSETMIWASIGEGLLEASASSVFTIYLTLVNHSAGKSWYLQSVLQSCVSMTMAAVAWHFYGQQCVERYEKCSLGIMAIFPQVLSRVTTFGLMAFLMSPLTSSSCFWTLHYIVILMMEISSNAALVQTSNRNITTPITMLFSIAMLFVGPPGFLDTLKQLQWPHLKTQQLSLLMWATITLAMSFTLPSVHAGLYVLWDQYYGIVAIWGASTLWTCARSICMSRGEEYSLKDRAEAANKKLYVAAKAGDKISCHLLMHVDGADKDIAKTWLTPTLFHTNDTTAFKWEGIEVLDGKLFCGPMDHSSVLVIDANTGNLNYIPTRDGRTKWNGIAACAGKLFCAPYNDPDILVIDQQRQVSYINTGRTGERKWAGITAMNGKLYCAPYNESDVLVIDAETHDLDFIPSHQTGLCKWFGILGFEGKLYCTPYNHQDILVIDPSDRKIDFIPTEREGKEKWKGMAAHNGRLYCAPRTCDDVLVINPASSTFSFIPTHQTGEQKWFGIAALGGKLYCSPCRHSDVLVIDPVCNSCSFIPVGYTQANITGKWSRKWSSMIAHGGKLYCAPHHAEAVLADASNIIDERMLLEKLGF